MVLVVSSVQNVSVIGNVVVKLKFEKIGFVGFALFAQAADAVDVSTNFGVRTFAATMKMPTDVDTLWHISGVVDASVRHQTMEGFGASGVWYTMNLFLRNDTAKLIDLMFKDLGLDIFRIGNVYQHDNFVQDIADFATVIAAGEKSLGRPLRILMSSWSPPAELKSNYQTIGGGTLASDPVTGAYRYIDYAQWWADSLDYLNETHGVQIAYLSIQNEPNIAAPYVSCLFDPNESASIAGYTEAFDAVYQRVSSRAHTMPKMIGPETCNFDMLSDYIGNFNDTSKIYAFAHHLYQQDVALYPNALNQVMAETRAKYSDNFIFQTEYSFLGENYNTALTRKLDLAQLIHNALTIEQVSAYLYWALYWGGEEGLVDIMSDVINIHPEYYAFKHFSAFVHADWQRISAEADGIAMSAYTSPANDKVTVVVINMNTSAVVINLSFNGIVITGGNIFRSSAHEDCELVGSFAAGSMLVIPNESITTLSLDGHPRP